MTEVGEKEEGGTEIYGDKSENRGRDNGKANMAPIDFTEFVAPSLVVKNVPTRIGPLLESGSYFSTQWDNGQIIGKTYNDLAPNESTMENKVGKEVERIPDQVKVTLQSI